VGILDWVVIAGYVCAMLLIGAYYARQNRSGEDFVLGGRRISPIALGLSLFATLVSTLTYLGSPGEMVAHGPMMMTQSASHPLVFLIVGYGLIPLLMRQPVTSAYEILETKLGHTIRLAGASIFLLLRMGWMATILYATSEVVLVPMLGLNSNWTPWLCIGLGVLTAIYSSMGGIRAVVMTDAIQSITMLAGAVITLAVISYKLGGVSAWWPTEWPAHWQTPSWGFDPSVRMSFGMLMMSTTLWYICTNGSDQMSIQRFLSTRDPATARKTLLVSQCTDVSVSMLLALTGLAVLGYYRVHPPALADGQTFKTIGDKLFPRFILEEMPAGLAGIVMAAIMSAALSSLSSGVNSAAAVLERDFFSRFDRAQLDPHRIVRRLRWLSCGVTFFAVLLSLLNLLIQGNLIERAFKMVNLLSAPLFVLFFLALFVKWSNAAGAWLGLLASIATAVCIAYSKELSLPIQLSFVWMLPSALIVGIVVGTLTSALFSVFIVKPAAD
jgi:SSS family solute:Na+ symporter